MGLLCNCPAGAALPDVPISECPESFGQIQKVVFQRIYSTGTTKNKFIKQSANPNVLASWTPLLAAADGTKVVQSPYISAPTAEAGAARKYGGGNATLGGVEIIIGREQSTFTGNLLQCPQTTIKALKELMCENVGIYLIDEYGRIGMLADDPDTIANYFPIPINGLFVGDKKLGGLEEPDMNVLSFNLYPNWSDDLVIVTPTNFNALTDLATPVGS